MINKDNIDWISLEETEELKRFKEYSDFMKRLYYDELVFMFCLDEDALVTANDCDIESCKKRYPSLWRNQHFKVKKLLEKIKTMENKVKIPASHLRAGNFHVGKDFSIPRLGLFSVKIDENSFHAITSYGISLVETGLVDFNPIPISENWLKKLGLIDGPNYHKENFGVINVDETGKFFFTGIKQKPIWIKWVHQLQNLYFAIYQEELELVKEND